MCATTAACRCFAMRRADAVVDVDAVRLRADGDDVGAELVEHRRRDVIAGAVGAIDDDAPALEIELVRKGALAELDVAAGGIVDPPRLAELRRRHAGERLAITLSIACSTLSGSFAPAPEKNLIPLSSKGLCDALITMPGGKPERARQVGDRWRGQRTGQQTSTPAADNPLPAPLRACSRRSACPCRSARRAHAIARGVCGKHECRPPSPSFSTSSGVIGGSPTGRAPRRFRSIVVSSHSPSNAAQTFRASTVSRTSCTRSMVAPRATAASAAARLAARRASGLRPVIVPTAVFLESPTSTG